jgi:prevent-host-death family protein
MVAKTVDIVEAQANLSELVSLVNTGVEVVLTKNSSPVACLVPMTSPRVPGLHPGAIKTSDDFDQPLPGAFWTGQL